MCTPSAFPTWPGTGPSPPWSKTQGALAGAEPGRVSQRAIDRSLHQVGSLGSGNHFLEVQVVDEIFDSAAAQAFGLAAGQVCVMIHCGSRRLGHQICTDHLRVMDRDGPLPHQHR